MPGLVKLLGEQGVTTDEENITGSLFEGINRFEVLPGIGASPEATTGGDAGSGTPTPAQMPSY